jgi:sulfate transporter 4
MSTPNQKDDVAEGTSSGFRLSSSGKSMSRLQSRVPVSNIQETSLLDDAAKVFKKQTYAYTEGTKGYSWYDWFAFFIPCLRWLRTYRVKEWLLTDILAGLSVGAMVIPQGMSYAKLAGLPQEYGLYGAFVPTIVYAFLGSSRQLAVGPVAVTSVLLGNGLETLFGSGGANPCVPPTGAVPPPPPPVDNATAPITCLDYQKAAIQIAFLAGVMYTAIGFLGLGWITYFLSHATISGFMSGAAILIALSQVKYILGISTPRADRLIPQLEYIFGNLSGFNWREFCMGMSFILILIVFRTASRRVKKLGFLRSLGPLTVCILSIALMNIFDWYQIPPGSTKPLIAPIGNIPKGMPSVTVNWWFPLYDVGQQLLLAVVICLIDMCESMSIAKALAAKNKYRLNATQELRGLGLANLAGAIFNCYTTTGSFSRTAVNDSVGAKSLVSSFVTGILVMFVLLFLTPVMKNMSQNVQGAIIITGVLGLFQWEDFLVLWKVAKFDWLVWTATFLCTLFLGVEVGILVGVALSLLLLVY